MSEPKGVPSPWAPITDPLQLKVLGKLGEEVNELGSAVSRCIIQGVDEAEPVTGKPNRQWLMEEMADVLANIELCVRHYGIDRSLLEQRKVRKISYLSEWLQQMEAPKDDLQWKITLTPQEVEFVQAVLARPGVKHPYDGSLLVQDDAVWVSLWVRPERLGLIEAVGSWKWKPTQRLLDYVGRNPAISPIPMDIFPPEQRAAEQVLSQALNKQGPLIGASADHITEFMKVLDPVLTDWKFRGVGYNSEIQPGWLVFYIELGRCKYVTYEERPK